MKVCLYGDSYVDDAPTSSNTVSWTSQLANDYGNIHNFGKCGSGPEYSLSQLRKHGGDLIIFVTGNPERLPFDDLPHPGLQVDISNLYYRKWPLSDAKPILSNYIRKHASSIKYMYRSLRESIIHRTEEIIAYLSYYSLLHKSYILCIPTTNPFRESSHNRIIPPEIRRRLSHKYFSLYPYNLASISLNEYTKEHKDTIKQSIGYVDFRQNHLSQCNHDILYANIQCILEHNPTQEHEKHFLQKHHSGDTYIYDE